MTKSALSTTFTIGVLALQGAFSEHIQLLRQATSTFNAAHTTEYQWQLLEVRTPEQLSRCDALIIPGGESTTISLVAARSGMLEPLREFVKVHRKSTWGTCAGLILLSESANRTKKGGQELIGGLDVRVNRNHFGRQTESFEAKLDLPFLEVPGVRQPREPFHSVFIRAPVVEKILPKREGIQLEEAEKSETVVAPSKHPKDDVARQAIKADVEIMARLPGNANALSKNEATAADVGEEGDIIAVRQGNVFATSFHPELTGDARIHGWWLGEVVKLVEQRRAVSI
ncbi:pyridoxine [Aulographum hederae CBS 113979]|uniref:glutaminase n=1 Tax=Aulographum hederae CBS 113979 TaxID=1176131 RepID=A0A6G1H7I7_9PEZI|nr:pyridoxine [Aulographum hederae CBS 113979]